MFALILGLVLALPARAIVGGVEPDADDARFDAVGALAVTWRLGLGPDTGDPATGPHNWYCAAVLTGPSEVRTARHCIEPYGAAAPHAVRFRRALDGSVGSVGAGVASFYHAFVGTWSFPGGDLAVGYLAEPVPHIAPLSLYGGVLAPGRELVVAGWGREGPGPSEGPFTRLKTCNTVLSAVDSTLRFPTAWESTLRLPCGPNSGDSGGGAVVFDGTTPMLAGIVVGVWVAVRP